MLLRSSQLSEKSNRVEGRGVRWCACIWLFSLLALCACHSRTTIANNLSERDANEMVVVLVSKGIEAQKIPAVA